MSKRLGPQLNHLWAELQGPERGALRPLKAAHTPEQAAIAWQRYFERGAPFEQKYNLRAQNARNVFNRLSGDTGSAPAMNGPASARAASAGTPSRTITETTPGVDNSAARRSLVLDFLGNKNSDVLDFTMQATPPADVPGTSTTRPSRCTWPSTATPGARTARCTRTCSSRPA